MSDSVFSQWGLSTETLRSIKDLGFENPTPVQSACIPHLLKNSGDLLALAKTGTGKTAAFGIPLVEKLTATPQLQALVLCPTRELATQVADSLAAMGLHKGLKVTTVLGGESYRKQIDSLRRNPQILVSTPGRLIDLMEQKIVKLDTVKTLILDEADEMLSFGFQEALETVWENLADNDVNTWLFSATMSDSIKRLTSKYLNEPYEVALNSASASTRVESFAAIVYEEDKEDALCLLLKNTPEFYGIIFAQTKKQVAELEIKFRSMGLAVDSLHGDKVQADRSRVIARMKKRDLQILVATDVAARGLDIEDLTHVVNFEIPWDAETYTHRIGRTARAGKTGIVWTLVRPKEAHQLRKFERALKQDFKPLHIPTVKEVRKNQIRNWLTAVHSTEIPAQDQEMLEELLVDLQAEKDFVLSASAKEWIFKALVHEKVGADFEGRQPRSFDLRPREDSRGARAHGDSGRSDRPERRSRPGLRSERSSAGGRSSGGYRSERASSERGGGGYRSERGPSERSERSERSSFRSERASSDRGGYRSERTSSDRPAFRSERSERSSTSSDRASFRSDRAERGESSSRPVRRSAASATGEGRRDRREAPSLRDRHPRKERSSRY